MIQTFLMAIGIVMIFEGIPYFTAPDQMKQLMASIIKMENSALRWIGITMMIGGLFCLSVSRL